MRALLPLLLILPAPLTAFTVVNGSFEDIGATTYVNIPDQDRDGNAAADGWTISSASPDWMWGEGPEGLWNTPWGDYFTLGAANGIGYREGVSQEISGFTVGASYTLTFSHANGLFYNGTAYEGVGNPGGWEVLLNGSTLFLADSVNPNFVAAPEHTDDWFTRNIEFVAPTETIEFEFLAYLNPQVNQQVVTFQFLDNVSISPVPEPGVLALIAPAILLGLRRRKP